METFIEISKISESREKEKLHYALSFTQTVMGIYNTVTYWLVWLFITRVRVANNHTSCRPEKHVI